MNWQQTSLLTICRHDEYWPRVSEGKRRMTDCSGKKEHMSYRMRRQFQSPYTMKAEPHVA